jgi:PAS domain S-box-containing protein
MNIDKQKTIFFPEDKEVSATGGSGHSTFPWFGRTILLGCAGVAAIALLGLLSYVPGLWILGSIRADYIPMAPSTALCFLVLCAVLFLQGRKSRPKPNLMAMLTLFVTLFSLLTIIGFLTGIDLSLEGQLTPVKATLGKIPVGRMSPASGAIFGLVGLGTFLLLLASRSSRHAQRLGNWAAGLGILTMLAGATVLLSYLYGAPFMYGGSSVPMAATTASAFMFFGVALVAATGPNSFPVCMMIGKSTSARLLRVFLPLTLGVVFLQSVLSRFLSAYHVIHDALLLAAMVIAAGAITAFVVVRLAHMMGGSIDEITEKLQESEEKWRLLVTTLPDYISLLDKGGRFLFLNHYAKGFSEKDVIGSSAFQYLSTESKGIFKKEITECQNTRKIRKFEHTAMGDQGIMREYDDFAIPVIEKNKVISTMVVSRDITESKQAVEEIKQQLSEKEILLKEVHHRIKNNIASVGGLISMRLQSVTNPEAIAVLNDAIGRIESMRILYDKLLLSEDYKDISVRNYVESLTDTLVALFPDNARITLDKRIADFQLDPKRLFLIGIIINELLTNTMKYAFVNMDAGFVKISLTNVDNHISLTIQDNGIGLPDGFGINESKGFGFMLVKMLSQQLGGSFSIEKKAGTRCVVEFDV